MLKISPYPSSRLFLCLLLSFAVHGVVLYPEGNDGSARKLRGDSPIQVSIHQDRLLHNPLKIDTDVVHQKAPVVGLEKRVDSHRTVTSMREIEIRKTVDTPTDKSITNNECVVASHTVCNDTVEQPKSVPSTHRSEINDSSGMTSDEKMIKLPTGRTVSEAEGGAVEHKGISEPVLSEAVPDYRRSPLPKYPFIARKNRWEGVVWLLVEVTPAGLVDDLSIEQSCGYRVLDRAALKTVRRWEFSPAMRAGVPIASQVRIPIRFRLEGS